MKIGMREQRLAWLVCEGSNKCVQELREEIKTKWRSLCPWQSGPGFVKRFSGFLEGFQLNVCFVLIEL